MMGVPEADIALQILKKNVLEDNKVDAVEVRALRDMIFDDGKVDRIEADVLFEINDHVSGNTNDPSWSEFFVRAITSHVLDDEESTCEIDEAEATYLISKIFADGNVDSTEKALLKNIHAKAGTIHKSLLDKMSELNI